VSDNLQQFVDLLPQLGEGVLVTLELTLGGAVLALLIAFTLGFGSRAVITVLQFNSRGVIFSRADTAGPTSDMQALYFGIPSDRTVADGMVRWTTGGYTFLGTWSAEW
jgi:ABC-type arginine/histidine transport system permease subunit